MKNVASLLFALSAFAGCVSSDVEDGRDDSFLGPGGKADTGSIVDGSPDAIAVLQVANERSATEMHDHGVPQRAADNIVAVRLGDDGVAGTSDDVTFATLAQLDAVPYVGPQAFARLLAYANELAGTGSGSGGTGSTPADLWTVAPCTPPTWAQLVALVPAGSTSFGSGRPYTTVTRHRDTCNPYTGCTSWSEQPISLWLHQSKGYNNASLLPVTTGSIGRTAGAIGTNGDISFVAYGNVFDFGYVYTFGSVSQTSPSTEPMHGTVSVSRDSAPYGYPSFSGPDWRAAGIDITGRVCADGSFHFTSTVLDDDSTSLQNLDQLAIYGQLW